MVTETCVTMPPRHTTKEGRQNWLRWIESMGFRVHDFSLIPQGYDGCGDLAFVRCNYDWSYTMKGRTEPVQDSGRFMAVLRKQTGDEWLATHWIWNSDIRRALADLERLLTALDDYKVEHQPSRRVTREHAAVGSYEQWTLVRF